MELFDIEKEVLNKHARELMDLALRSDITREKYVAVLEKVYAFGYTTGYGDGCLDGAEDTTADEYGDIGHIDNARCRF